MKRVITSLAVAALAAAILLPTGCAERRTTTTVHRVLPNGVTVVARENRASEVAAIDVFVRDGALFETTGQAGEANLLRSLMFYETETRPPAEIQRTIEGLGGVMSSAARHDFSLYSIIVPSASFQEALGLVADGLSNAVLDEELLERGKENALTSIEQMGSRPVDRAYRLCLSELMGDHPYGRLPEGEPETLPGIKVDELRERYVKSYIGPNIVVSVAGNIDPVDAGDRVARAFSVFSGGEPAEPASLPVEWPTEPRRVVERADVARAVEVIGFPGPSIADQDNISMDVLLVVLMEGRSSKLNLRLKEELGLVHSIGAGWYTMRQPSPLFVWMELPEENTLAAESAVVELFRELATEPISDDDLEKARILLEVGNLRMTETAEGQAFHMGYWNSVGDADFANQYVEKLAAVTAEEVQRAAQRYLTRDGYLAAVVLPR
ncbi:MAG: insulinase family protein [Candidatus Eisenbacteria bacterium]|nr:insulinase family protein [Candidatus Eisenbacteria bacterium]